MDPLAILNLGIALANAGIKIWGDVKAIQSTPAVDGSQDVILTISVRQEKLAQYLATEQSDLSETLTEIERRKANP